VTGKGRFTDRKLAILPPCPAQILYEWFVNGSLVKVNILSSVPKSSPGRELRFFPGHFL
jgi:hypothetical protein